MTARLQCAPPANTACSDRPRILLAVIDAWRWSAVTGILLGLAAFVVLFVPILVWQSRRFGRVRGVRTVAAGAAAVYGVTILAYTLLPLPDPGWCATHGSKEHYFTPLHSIGEIRRAIDGLSTREALRSFAVLQVAMNVVLFVPWGAFVRRLFGRSILVAGLSGVVASLLIEASQGTGLWGIYRCAYRVADVDDVITNSLGAFLGAVAAPLVLWWLPTTERDVAHRHEPRPVTRGRRMAGMAIDAFSFFGLWSAISLLLIVVDRYELGQPVTTRAAWVDQTLPGIVAFVVVVALPMSFGSGASLGQRAMWLCPDPPLPIPRRVLRSLTGFGGFAAIQVAAATPGLPRWLEWTANGVSWAFLVAATVALATDPSGRGLSFRACRCGLADSRAAAET